MTIYALKFIDNLECCIFALLDFLANRDSANWYFRVMARALHSSLMLYVTVVVLCSGAGLVAAYSSGAPHHRCSNLVPFHGGRDPQTGAPPYELTVSSNSYSPGQTIQVTLSSTGGSMIRGFALTARRVRGDTEELVGGFQVPPIALGNFWYSQNSSTPNCVTHSEPFPTITINWTAPAKSVGDIAFTTPVVQTFAVFWANLTSNVVTANVPSQDEPFPPLNIARSSSPISGSCGTDFGCIRSPALCDLASCEIYVKFVYLESADRIRFELHATGNYVSMGLSDDDKMSDDLTLTCTADDKGYSMQLGYNPTYRRLNERHRWISLSDKYIERLTGNRLRCEFTMPLVINITTYLRIRQAESNSITNRTFDLRNPYYMFVAYGSTYLGSSSAVRHVEMPAISNCKVNLLGRGSCSAHRISGLKRAHGGVMLLAWQVLIPLGANVAMFYRCLFVKSVGGIQLWFHLHRGFVISGFGLTIIGLLLIFAQFSWRWSAIYTITEAHGAMGLTVLGLSSVQILMGILRPDKDAPRRPMFKLAHQIVGYSSLGLAECVFIVIGFLSAMPQTYRTPHLILAFGWLVFHLAFRILVSVLLARWDRKVLSAVNKPEIQADLESGKQKTLRLLFIIFLTGMLVFFLAWFVTLMLF